MGDATAGEGALGTGDPTTKRPVPIRGEITEIVGGPSSGRTSHLVACLRYVASRGETAALVDTEEVFDPGLASRAGVDLRRLLWVRCGGHRDVALRAAVERCEPALRECSLAILSARVDGPNVGRGGAPTADKTGAPTAKMMMVLEANAEAREQGVRPGMTEPEARARCPMLVTRPWVEEYVVAARHALLEAALAVSPRIEDGGAGLVYVDTVGLERLIGDPPSIGRRLVHQARAVGLTARVGLAASRTAARVVAARASGPVTVVPEGRERAGLAGAPLATLALSPDLPATLARCRVRTLAALPALPRAGLATRPGPARPR